MDPERDKRISDHVLRMHRYRNPGEQDGEGMVVILEYLYAEECIKLFQLGTSNVYIILRNLTSVISTCSQASCVQRRL